MIENHEFNDAAVDLREETLITRHPGYVATETVVVDVAAERRMDHSLRNRILWSLLGFLEILLATRILLRLIAADANSGFAMVIYGITGVFVGPFNGMVATPTSGGSSLEVTTLIAMLVYALAFLAIRYVFRLLASRSGIRSFTRTTRELSSDGAGSSVRTTHTTLSDGDGR